MGPGPFGRGCCNGPGAWQAMPVAPWKLPLMVAAIAVPVVAGFYLGGPGVGVLIGALAAVALIGAAVRQRPHGPIGAAGAGAGALVVLAEKLEEPEAVATVAAAARASMSEGSGGVTVLAPARIGFLDRWASDVEDARRGAQQRLVISVAALAAAGVEAEARVGDEDIVQAVEDQLGALSASRVILVAPAVGEDEGVERAAAELRSRLRPGFLEVRVGSAAPS